MTHQATPLGSLAETVDSELHLCRNHSRKSKLRYRANRQSRTDCHQDSRRQYWRHRDRNTTESRTRRGQHDAGRHRGHPVYRPKHRHLHYCASSLSRETTPIRARIIEASYRPSAEPVYRPRFVCPIAVPTKSLESRESRQERRHGQLMRGQSPARRRTPCGRNGLSA